MPASKPAANAQTAPPAPETVKPAYIPQRLSALALAARHIAVADIFGLDRDFEIAPHGEVFAKNRPNDLPSEAVLETAANMVLAAADYRERRVQPVSVFKEEQCGVFKVETLTTLHVGKGHLRTLRSRLNRLRRHYVEFYGIT